MTPILRNLKPRIQDCASRFSQCRFRNFDYLKRGERILTIFVNLLNTVKALMMLYTYINVFTIWISPPPPNTPPQGPTSSVFKINNFTLFMMLLFWESDYIKLLMLENDNLNDCTEKVLHPHNFLPIL